MQKAIEPHRIEQHCKNHRIKIFKRPSGAVRFIGDGVDVIYAEWQYVKLTDLHPYDPPAKRQAGQA